MRSYRPGEASKSEDESSLGKSTAQPLQKKHKSTEQDTPQSITPLVFEPVLRLAREMNEQALRALLWPATDKCLELLSNYANQDMSVSYELCLNDRRISPPLVWALEQLASEKNIAAVNWLIETFDIPVLFAIKGYARGGHKNMVNSVMADGVGELDSRLFAAIGYALSGDDAAVDALNVFKSAPTVLIETYAELGNEEKVNQLMAKIAGDYRYSSSKQAQIRGYARGGHINKALAVVSYVDDNDILDDRGLLVLYLAASGQIGVLAGMAEERDMTAIMFGLLYSGMPIAPQNSAAHLFDLIKNNENLLNIFSMLYCMVHPELLVAAGISEADLLGQSGVAHRKIVSACNSLGLSFSTGGVCRGLSLMSSQSWLVYEEQKLQDRFSLICNTLSDQLNNLISAALGRLKKNPDNEDDLNWLESRAFLEAVCLAQEASKYRFATLFAKNARPKSQRDLQSVLPLIASKKLEQVGGMEMICAYSGVYVDQDELARYFASLVKHLHSVSPKFQGRISFALQSSMHSIMIGYDAKERGCFFNNAGHISNELMRDTTVLAEMVMQAFELNTETFFATEVFSTGDDKEVLAKVFQSWRNSKEFHQSHAVTERKAQLVDENGVGWLYLACQNGFVDTAKSLLEVGADANQKGGLSFSPLLSAAYNGYVDIVELLLTRGVDVDQVSADGVTALMVAAEGGQENMVNLLLRSGADTLLQNKDNLAAVNLARRNGYDEIADMIAQHQADNSIRVNRF